MAVKGIDEIVESMRAHAIPWVASAGEALADHFSGGDMESAAARILPWEWDHPVL